MRIVHTVLRETRVPFVTPWRTPDGELDYRRSLILMVETDDGKSGCGEIAPLPGFSNESWQDALDQANLLTMNLSSILSSGTREDSKEFIARVMKNDSIAPSVRFGFETAIADLISRMDDAPLSHWLGGHQNSVIPVNAVIGANEPDIEGAVRRISKSGYRSFKLKVSAETAEADVVRVQAVRDLLTYDCTIRLDANRSFTPDGAARFMDRVGTERIEYIEEPLAFEKIDSLEELASRTGVRIAVDESLSDPDLRNELLSSSAVSVVILKPTLLGGLIRCCDIAERAHESGKRVVVTSSLETGLGVAACAHLAAAVTDGITACGLDTLSIFEYSSVNPELQIENGFLRLPGPGLGVTPVFERDKQ